MNSYEVGESEIATELYNELIRDNKRKHIVMNVGKYTRQLLVYFVYNELDYVVGCVTYNNKRSSFSVIGTGESLKIDLADPELDVKLNKALDVIEKCTQNWINHGIS